MRTTQGEPKACGEDGNRHRPVFGVVCTRRPVSLSSTILRQSIGTLLVSKSGPQVKGGVIILGIFGRFRVILGALYKLSLNSLLFCAYCHCSYFVTVSDILRCHFDLASLYASRIEIVATAKRFNFQKRKKDLCSRARCPEALKHPLG